MRQKARARWRKEAGFGCSVFCVVVVVLPSPFHVIGKKDVARSEQGNVPSGIHAFGCGFCAIISALPDWAIGEGGSPGQNLALREQISITLWPKSVENDFLLVRDLHLP